MCDFTLDDIKRVVLEAIAESKNNQPKQKTSSYIDQCVIDELIGTLNHVSGSRFRPTNEMTKRLISARWREGFTFKDMHTVIVKKWDEWGKDKDMVRFFRPETLFGNKFESYLINAGRKEAPKTKPYSEWTEIEKEVGKPKEFWSEKETKGAERV